MGIRDREKENEYYKKETETNENDKILVVGSGRWI